LSGQIKSSLVIAGETVLSRTLAAVKNFFNEIILVTNTPGEFLNYADLIVISDQYKGIGPLGGIHAALHCASNDAVFVFAGDMPLLNTLLIEKQIGLFMELRCDILVPKIGNSIEPLHSIIDKSVLIQLEKYLSEKRDPAVRKFLQTVNTRYMELEESEDIINMFSNINSPSDIIRLEKIIMIDK
jgi:molybdopterin-guanine dinucleotide biosynthesis protein A